MSESGMLATVFIFDIQHALQRMITANTYITKKKLKQKKNPTKTWLEFERAFSV